MRNGLALLAGFGMILVAFLVGVQRPRDESRPQAAAAFATALHSTLLPPAPQPSPTPPLPAPSTPITSFLTYGSPTPSPDDLIALLSSAAGEGRLVITQPGRLTILSQHPYYLGQEEIVTAGDRALLAIGGQKKPASFGAILLWDRGRFRVKFEHVQTGIEPEVSVSLDPATAEIDFAFRDAGARRAADARWRSYPVECFVDSCAAINRDSMP